MGFQFNFNRVGNRDKKPAAVALFLFERILLLYNCCR